MAASTELLIQIKATNAQAKKVADDTKRSFSEMSGSLRKTGGILTAAVTAPLVLMGKEAVSAASDMSESMGKVGVVFGDLSDDVVAWSETSAESFGLSQQAALEAAGTFGNLFTAMNLPADAAADMSTELVQLAGDLASFNNISVDDALVKLRAGLVGEVEPLRTLGVQLDAASTKAKAMAMGLAESEDALTQADLAQARYALILEQTATAQGDFARTSDGLANSQRTLQAQLGDLASELGTVLLPYITKLVNWISKAVQWFDSLSPSMQKVVVVVGLIAAAIGPLLMGIGMIMPAIEAAIAIFGVIAGVLSGPVLLAIAAVIAIVAALAWAWNNNFMGIRDKTQAVIDFIAPYIQAGIELIKNVISSALEFIKGWWDEHGESVMTIVNALWGFITAAFDMYTQSIMVAVRVILNLITSFWEAHGETVMTVVNNLWEMIKTIFQTGAEVIGNIIDLLAAVLTGDWETAKEELIAIGDTLWAGMVKVFELGKDSIVAIVSDLVDTVIGFFTGIAEDAYNAGAALAQRFADGITSKISAAIDKAKELAEKLRGYLPGSDAKVGPLSDLYKSGQAFSQTFAAGIENAMPAVQVAGLDVVSSIEPSAIASGNFAPQYTTNLTINNPVGRTAPEDVFKSLRILSALGVAAT